MTTPRPARAGDPITAAGWNALVERVGFRPSVGAGVRGPLTSGTTTILVKNTTASEVSKGGVLGIGAAVFEPTESEEFVFEGEAPAAEHTAAYCVLTDVAEPDKVVVAVVMGNCSVRVDPDEDLEIAVGDYLGPKVGETGYLTAGGGSAQVLHVQDVPAVEDDPETDEDETAPPERWAYVRIGAGTSRPLVRIKDADAPVTPDRTDAIPAKYVTIAADGTVTEGNDVEPGVYASQLLRGALFLDDVVPCVPSARGLEIDAAGDVLFSNCTIEAIDGGVITTTIKGVEVEVGGEAVTGYSEGQTMLVGWVAEPPGFVALTVYCTTEPEGSE